MSSTFGMVLSNLMNSIDQRKGGKFMIQMQYDPDDFISTDA